MVTPIEQYKTLRDECEAHGEGPLVEIYDYVAQLEALWIEYLKQADLYSDSFGGVEIPEELSGELDIGLPLARKICKALGGK